MVLLLRRGFTGHRACTDYSNYVIYTYLLYVDHVPGAIPDPAVNKGKQDPCSPSSYRLGGQQIISKKQSNQKASDGGYSYEEN